MDISQVGINLIKKFEGLATKAYYCLGGKLTIGYGHVIKENEQYLKTALITQHEAEDLLKKDITWVVTYINKIVKEFNIPLENNKISLPLSSSIKAINQNMFDALCSFCFNTGNFTPPMLKRFAARDLVAIGNSLILYTKTNGKELPGLVTRRKAEQELYFSNF